MQKVLIIDAAPTVHSALALCLRSEAVTIHSAHDGQAGIDSANALGPDLILLDVDLPGTNGLDVCRRLKRGKKTREIPIIMVTTRGETDSVERGYLGGCNDYVTKPVNANELLTKIRNLLGGAR